MLAQVRSDYGGESLDGRHVPHIVTKHKLLQDFSQIR